MFNAKFNVFYVMDLGTKFSSLMAEMSKKNEEEWS